MKISRREVLEAVGTSVVAVGTIGCDGTPQNGAASAQAPTGAPAPAPAAAAAASGEFRLVFGGLQLFVIPQDHKTVTVVMPKAARGITPHRAQLGVLGGAVASKPASGTASVRSPFGIDAHAFDLDEYSIQIDGGIAGTPLTVTDTPALRTMPANANQWKSMRHIPDFALMHPRAKLKSGWNTTLAQSAIEITGGELSALPGYDKPPSSTVYAGQYFSHFSTLRLPTNGKVKLVLTPLPGSKKTASQIELELDSTGPMVALLAFAPATSGGVDHGTSIDGLFDDLSKTIHTTGATPKSGSPMGVPFLPTRISIASTATGSIFQPLFNMLSDGTPSCPPYSFRP